MKTKKIGIIILATILTLVMLAGCGNKTKDDTISTKMRDITSMELVQDMGIGINLGNTFESCGTWINSNSVTNYETGWGSPVITEEIIKGYSKAGFGVLRVPVAWSNMMSKDYTINSDYLARVKEVIDWALKSDLYVVVNIHWDSGWWEKFPEDKENCMNKYKSIWTQLSDEFKSYGDYLMFESLNEEGCWNDVWNRYGGTEGKEEAYSLLNEINQTFVDVVRNSGGNNEKRHLLIAGYATDIERTCDELFKMPEDVENRCSISVHYYTPPTFCILENDADWGKARTEWGTDADIADLDRLMLMMKERFIDNGIPVIIGEYGVSTKNKTTEMIRLYLTSVCKTSYSYGMCPVLWDITDVFYDRKEFKMIDSELEKEFKDIAKIDRNS